MKRILLALLLIANATLANDSSNQKQTLHSVELKGNTVFSCASLQHIFDPYLNRALSKNDQVEIARKINHHYQSNGYTFSCVHKILYNNSKLYIEILEGSIRRVECDNTLKNNKLLQRYIEIIQSARPFNIQKLERTIALISYIPGIKGKEIAFIPRPAYKAKDVDINNPAVIDLILLQSGYDKIQALFSFNNTRNLQYVSTTISNQQYLIAGELPSILAGIDTLINNPFNVGDHLNIFLSSSWDKMFHKVDISYEIPLNLLGTRLEAAASYLLSQRLVKDEVKSASLQISHPVFLTRAQSFEIESKLNFGSIQEKRIPFYEAKYSKIILNSTYKAAAYGKHFYQLSFHQSIANKEESTKKSFNKFVFAGMLTFPLYKDMLTFEVDANAQYTASYLPKFEYFAAGGSRGGRGFRYAEIVGKKGASVASEIVLSKPLQDFIFTRHKYYAYLDASWASGTEESQYQSHILSSGIGTELVLSNNAVITLELSKPIKNTAQNTHKSSSRPKVIVGFEYYFRY